MINPSAAKYLYRQVALVLSMSLMTCGYTSFGSASAVLLPQLRLPDSGIITNDFLDSMIASMPAIGALVGVQLTPFLVSLVGRKTVQIINNIPIIVGWIVVAHCSDTTVMIITRFIQGITLGVQFPNVTPIIAECTDPLFRGAFLCSVSAANALGTLYVHLIGTFVSWRLLSYLSIIPSVLGTIIYFYLPDSPVSLYWAGKHSEASSAYSWYRGCSDDVIKEFEELKVIIAKDKAISKNRSGWSISRVINDFQRPDFYKPFTIMIIIFTLYSWSGVYVLVSYMVDILENISTLKAGSYTIMNSLDAFRVVLTIASPIVVKRMKRRNIVFYSSLLSMFSLYALSIYIKMNTAYGFKMEAFPLLALLVYTVAVTLGTTTMPYVIFGEVFPTKYKDLGSSLTSLYLFMALSSALMSGPHLLSSLGESLTFSIYGTVIFVCWLILHFILPETKDKPLYEVERFFLYSDKEPHQAELSELTISQST